MGELTQIELVPFEKNHFLAYQSWFTDEILNTALGPKPDQQWLKFVLSDRNGCQLSAVQGGQLVAVIGIALPCADKAEPKKFVITDLAVDPQRRGRGVGAGVLVLLQSAMQTDKLFAFVDQKNQSARKFFESNGWFCAAGKPDDDDMYEFQSPVVASPIPAQPTIVTDRGKKRLP